MPVVKHCRPYILLLIILIINRSGVDVLSQSVRSGNNRTFSIAYHYPYDAEIRYLNYNKINQTINNKGRKINAGVVTVNYCSVRNLGSDGKMLKLEFIIDSIQQYLETASSFTSSQSKSAIGRPFNMSVTSSGNEIEASGLSELVFTNDDSTELYASQFFTDFFPSLPEGRIMDGYSWDFADTILSEYGESYQTTCLNYHNTVEGEVWYKGRECIKISSNASGTIDIKSINHGSNIHVAGEIYGSRVYYLRKTEGNFIYLGYLLYDREVSSVTGTLDIDSGLRGSFPIIMRIERLREAEE